MIEVDESVVPEGYEARPKLILRQKAAWRDAKVSDIGRCLACRCKDHKDDKWVEQGVLCGWIGRDSERWYSSGPKPDWAYCQVLDKAGPQ